MKSQNTDEHIRNCVKSLIAERGIKKVHLGKFLGGTETESRQQQFARAQRFLDGNSPIKIGTLSHLVEFFEKPLAYFLPESSLYPTALNSAEKTTTTPGQPELKVIADNLRKLGLDEDFIKNQLRQIEAMEAYHGH